MGISFHKKKRNLITEEEARVLCEALRFQGEITFPISPSVVGAVVGTVMRAQKGRQHYTPSFRERLLAKISHTYASVASFIIWIGVNNVSLEPGVSDKNGSSCLKLKLQSNHKIEWDALKASAFRAPLI